MTVQFDSRADNLRQRLYDSIPAALDTAGQTIQAQVRQQMLTGYPQPILSSGALLQSIAYVIEGNTLHIGSDLPYAAPVHDGSARVPGRPFLQDGILGSMEDIRSALAQSLSERIP